jgi:hypothetical protein
LIERFLVALKDRKLESFAAPSGEVGFGSNSLAHQAYLSRFTGGGIAAKGYQRHVPKEWVGIEK